LGSLIELLIKNERNFVDGFQDFWQSKVVYVKAKDFGGPIRDFLISSSGNK
jgi:hypothetical protein